MLGELGQDVVSNFLVVIGADACTPPLPRALMMVGADQGLECVATSISFANTTHLLGNYTRSTAVQGDLLKGTRTTLFEEGPNIGGGPSANPP